MLRFFVPTIFAFVAGFGFASNTPLAVPLVFHPGDTHSKEGGHGDVVASVPASAHGTTEYGNGAAVGDLVGASRPPVDCRAKPELGFDWTEDASLAFDSPHEPMRATHGSADEVGMLPERPPLAPFASVGSVVSQTLERLEPFRPCGDEPASGHCVCVTITWLCGGEEHSVTYQLCSACDVRALRSIIQQGTAFGCTLISRRMVACE